MFDFFKKRPQKNDDIVFEKVKKALWEQGFVIDKIDGDGLIHVSKGDFQVRVSLDNVRKQYQRDKNESCIESFIKAMADACDPIPDWQTAKSNIYLSLFPSNHDFGDFINYPVTEKFNTIFIYSSNAKNNWVNYDQLRDWNISEKELVEIAYQNMDIELTKASLETTLIEDKKLAFFETKHDTLKSSLLLSKNLKQKVFNELGWGIYAVLPVRDFCYMFSENDIDFFSERLGAVVVDEFKKSGYPITTEIIKIDDDGINVYGEYPVE